MSKRRKTSSFAQARQCANIPTLIVAGYLKFGDSVVYEYQGRKFSATVVVGGYLQVDASVNDGARALRRPDGNQGQHYVYENPTNWTEDCIADYNRRNNKVVRTRASPYSRIVVGDGTETLQDLRNRFMRDYINMAPVETPNAIRDMVNERTGSSTDDSDASSASSSSSSSASASSASASPKKETRPFPPAIAPTDAPQTAEQKRRLPTLGLPLTVQRVQDAMGTSRYREIAYLFEGRHNRLCAKMTETTEALRRAEKALATLTAVVKKAQTDGFDVTTSLDDNADWRTNVLDCDAPQQRLMPPKAGAARTPVTATKRARVTFEQSVAAAKPTAKVGGGLGQKHSIFSAAIFAKHK